MKMKKPVTFITGLYSERDLNPHEHCCSLDFKSSVSTNFTIRAFCLLWDRNNTIRTAVLERKTGLEPATSTLARSRSTN